MSNRKNIGAIEKIISELARRDMMAHYRVWRKTHKKRYDKHGNPICYPGGYSLSAETMEAREVRDDYIHDKISEEEYKAYCLKKRFAYDI